MQKDVAVMIQNYVQFINLKSGIDKLIAKGYTVDIYCPTDKSDVGYKDMYNDIRKYLKNNGYTVYNEVNNFEYKVLLEPYPFMLIKSKYVIKYRYGCISAKPSIVYRPDNYLKYDAILCAGSYDANYLSVFSKTYQTGNMKYANFKKKNKKIADKKILLYLPTYGDSCSIDEIIDELAKLKKDYYIIAKIHHGTNFVKAEKERIKKLKNIVDEFYDSHKDLSELLSVAEVVLTDNSGSIFEAIYTDTPVAIFCDDVNKHKLGNFNTTQYELVKEGIIPYTNDKNEIDKILKKALSKNIIEKQQMWNKDNLYHPKNQVKDFVNIIEKYIKDDIDERYYEMHNILKSDYYTLCNSIIHMNNTISSMQTNLNNIVTEKDQEITLLKKNLNYYENGKLYKIAKKIYKIFRRG